MRFSKVVPSLLLVLFAILTISNLRADPPRRTRTPTPAQTAAPAARTAAAPAAQPTTPPAAPTAAPAKAAAAAPAAGPAKADVDAGKALYAKLCQKCHGPNGEGVQRMYDLVGAKLASIASKPTQSKSD